MLALPSRCT